MRIYSFSGGRLELRLQSTLRPGTRFVDIAGISGKDRLISYYQDRFSWFDPDSATERDLFPIATDFDPPSSAGLLHVDVTEDVNRDGRDDLVVPAAGGFRVILQSHEGAFVDALQVGVPSDRARVYGADGYRYRPWGDGGRVHQADFDRDGRVDLVFWNQDHFEVHLQSLRGGFEPEPRVFETEVAIDSDDVATLAAPEGVRDREKDQQPVGRLEGRVLQSLEDVNGDGVVDMVVFSLSGGSLWRMRSAYEVHFGRPTAAGGIEFQRQVGTSIESKGIPFGVEEIELGGADPVVSFMTINPSFFKAIGMVASALVTRTVAMELKLFRPEEGVFPARPTAVRKVRTHIPSGGGQGLVAFFPPVLTGDVDGDGRSDLVIGTRRKGIKVFLGQPGPELIAREPARIPVAVPYDEEFSWLVDLNRDGKDDIVLHYVYAEHLSVLIAQ